MASTAAAVETKAMEEERAGSAAVAQVEAQREVGSKAAARVEARVDLELVLVLMVAYRATTAAGEARRDSGCRSRCSQCPKRTHWSC